MSRTPSARTMREGFMWPMQACVRCMGSYVAPLQPVDSGGRRVLVHPLNGNIFFSVFFLSINRSYLFFFLMKDPFFIMFVFYCLSHGFGIFFC